MKYDHLSLEKKWQHFWKVEKTFKAIEDPTCPKYYVLDMFPYPSGAGLHVGHLVGYTATDILARYKRQNGYNVLHPMGWDSFGLPAEQYAIRTGAHPAITTHANVKKFKEQLEDFAHSIYQILCADDNKKSDSIFKGFSYYRNSIISAKSSIVALHKFMKLMKSAD